MEVLKCRTTAADNRTPNRGPREPPTGGRRAPHDAEQPDRVDGAHAATSGSHAMVALASSESTSPDLADHCAPVIVHQAPRSTYACDIDLSTLQ